MCGVVSSLVGGLASGLFGSLFGGDKKSPPIVQSTPLADQAAADAKAAGDAAQDRTRRRRSMRASSLLATGGDGDLSNPVTGAPSVAGKPTLGA